MSPKEQREHWMHICDALRNAREGVSIDLHKVAEVADRLRPHWPSFDYTLRLISQKIRSGAVLASQGA